MSYQFADSVGIQPTANIIRQSGLTKILVFKYGSSPGSLPVFEDSQSKTNDRIVKAFTDWASTILQGNPYNDTVYEVFLFNEVETEEGEQGTGTKRGYSKRNKTKFNFQLFRSGMGENKTEPTIQGTNEQQIEAIYQRLRDDKILSRLDEIDKRVTELEESLDGDEEEEETGSAIADRQFATIEKFIGLLQKDKSNVTVNGTEEKTTDTKEITANINKAVKILYQHDKSLDKHLLKLANLAENNKILFDQVIMQLDKL